MHPLTVLLMRHGHAVDDAPSMGDHGRWLTVKGREKTRHAARLLAAREERPGAILTSPYVRAVQTAEIVAAELGYAEELTALAELVVEGHPRAVAQMIREHSGPHSVLMLVGHEPSLSVLANTLLGAHEWGGFKKAQILGLTLDSRRANARRAFTIDP